MITVFFKKKDPSVLLPSYSTEGSAGADIRAYLPSSSLTIPPGEWRLVPTGLMPEIPEGWEIQMRPRSGLAARNGISMVNAPGTIDSDYRGEMKVNLINHSTVPFTVENGDRIAQIVVAPSYQAVFSEKEELSDTQRGTGGFGSTGLK